VATADCANWRLQLMKNNTPKQMFSHMMTRMNLLHLSVPVIRAPKTLKWVQNEFVGTFTIRTEAITATDLQIWQMVRFIDR
jgi:hypothetical protein